MSKVFTVHTAPPPWRGAQTDVGACPRRSTMRCHFDGSLLAEVLPPLLATQLVCGLLGNGLALWIFCFHLKPRRSSTVLVFNLAVADFLLNVALPFRATYYMSGVRWMLGGALCNLCLFMLAMNRRGSTFFLTAIALDRYMRVVHPHHRVNSLSVSKATCGAVAVWLLAVSMTAHIFWLRHDNTSRCESFSVDPERNLTWHELDFLVSFLVPLLVILFCTIGIIRRLRRRTRLSRHAKVKRTLRLVVLVAAVFVVCFLPSSVMQVVIWIETRHLVRSWPASQVCGALEGVTTAFYISISLTYLNSTLDPLIYYFSSPAIKKVCKEVLRRKLEGEAGTSCHLAETGRKETGAR